MTLRAINNMIMQMQPTQSPHSSPSISEGKESVVIQRNFRPVSYVTSDGGLFVGYYLNIHG